MFDWAHLVGALHARGVADAETAFQFIDSDGGGTVSYAELQAAVTELGLPHTEADCRRMMREADTSGDGEVDLDEFLAWQQALNDAQKAEGDWPQE